MKERSYRLSIIIPYKNKAECLEKLLESIVAEADFLAAQVIVVDDHSTEQFGLYESITLRFAESVEFYVNESANPGAGAARNTGLRKAKGEWLLFADADDLLVSGWYRLVASCYESAADIICFTPVSIYADTELEAGRHVRYARMVNQYLNNRNGESEDRLRYEYLVPWSKIIRRSLVTDNLISFDEVMHANDNMFSVRCGAAAKEVAASRGNIYCAVDRQGSLTKNQTAAVFFQREQVRCHRYNFVKQLIGKDRFRLLDISVLGPVSMAKVLKLYFLHKYNFTEVRAFWNLFHNEQVNMLPDPRYICANAGRLFRHFFKGEVY